MHIFLTGERQTGKSTMVREILSQTKRPAMGLKSVSFLQDGDRVVYLFPISDGSPAEKNGVKAGIFRDRQVAEVYCEAFEEYGTSLLSGIPSGTLVVIDEVGRMEKDAVTYNAQVLSLLERDDITVFGVVQQMAETELANAIRSHQKVELLEVSRENWNEVFQKTKEKLI